MSDRIVKLVFIRVEGADGARKAVVPLVEGCDFETFLVRVRRRLQLPENTELWISDPATGPVDTIDRLLEAEEGNTLDIRVPQGFVPQMGPPRSTPTMSTPSIGTPRPGTPASTARGPMHHRSGLATGGACSSDGGGGAGGLGVAECRVDVALSPGGVGGHADDSDGESGALKYRKRKTGRTRQIVIALLLIAGTAAGAFQILGPGFSLGG